MTKTEKSQLNIYSKACFSSWVISSYWRFCQRDFFQSEVSEYMGAGLSSGLFLKSTLWFCSLKEFHWAQSSDSSHSWGQYTVHVWMKMNSCHAVLQSRLWRTIRKLFYFLLLTSTWLLGSGMQKHQRTSVHHLICKRHKHWGVDSTEICSSVWRHSVWTHFFPPTLCSGNAVPTSWELLTHQGTHPCQQYSVSTQPLSYGKLHLASQL